MLKSHIYRYSVNPVPERKLTMPEPVWYWNWQRSPPVFALVPDDGNADAGG
jgi:hypothetical protein